MGSKKNRRCVVVLGMMGGMPFAGMAWQGLHYLEGLRRLDCDVYYIEDTGSWPFDIEQELITEDVNYTLKYLSQLMPWCGLEDRWAYRNRFGKDSRYHGMGEGEVSELWRRADAIVNLCGATELQEEHLRVPVRIYLETDPVLREIQIAKGNQEQIDFIAAHTHLFTFGENYGAPDCRVPLGPYHYQRTRQPIVLDWWKGDLRAPADAVEHQFRTIASWNQGGQKDIEWNGETYFWSKHIEFMKFLDLPRESPIPLELALATSDVETIRMLTSHGWSIVDAIQLSKEIIPYRDYILASRGEFTVAKDQNIRLRSGWFSDRSACYLAAGKPVITQDTGFGNVLPTGKGLFAFTNMQEIVCAMDAIESDYERHGLAAREIAHEYFAAEKVLSNLLEQVGL
jgi:hypothetical protein